MKTKIAELLFHQFISFVIFLSFLCSSLKTDTIASSSVIKDPDTIVSRGQVFKLGFFTPENTTNRYLGVFYAFSEKTVVWVANRDKPLNDSSSTVTISKDGNIVLINGRNQTVWSTNATTSPMNTILQIQDTGNLVLRDNSTGTTIWESFSQPCDVYLPTMKISHNINTGKKVFLSAWRNATDPEVGSFTFGLEALNIPQKFIWKDGRPYWRSGPWNGLIFIGIQNMYFAYLDGFNEMKNDSAGNFYSTLPEREFFRKLDLNSSGSIVETEWDDQKKSWDTKAWAPESECDIYGMCGPFGSCNAQEAPICSCLRGFEPANIDEWDRGNWTSGCKRKNQLQCDAGGSGDGFFMLQFMKVPDFAERVSTRREDECRTKCLRNCSCIAYAHDSNISCMFWSHALIDIQKFRGVGIDLYIRLSALELDHQKKDPKKIIIILVVVGFVILSICIFISWKWDTNCRDKKKTIGLREEATFGPLDTSPQDPLCQVNLQELPLFISVVLANATNNFSEANKLGKGGFGYVYKGELVNGREIAVKRLSQASGQGMQEFMNEVVLISKLQHRNLVKLLGCCIENKETMLIYEYMPNKSLDFFLFDSSQEILDWRKRFNIIEGICRGLLYLHRDSRLKIIHRDLKPSNILLDNDWNPKISDFGMARIFGTKQDHVNTVRVVGTYGYMAPEYAMEGRYSEKSDIFSFGVLILEIAAGRRNTSFQHEDGPLNLLGHVWTLWNEDNVEASIDSRILSPSYQAEVVRCIHIGLLCVQELPKDRPSISAVLSMLSSEIIELPEPKQPAFTTKSSHCDIGTNSSQQSKGSSSVNNVSLTTVCGR